MKKLLLLCLGCVMAVSVFAQDTVKKTNKIGEFNEEFSVLKSNKKLRQGTYQLFLKKQIEASGKYDQGKRVGLWSFYTGDKLIQQYDYTTSKIVSSVPETEITTKINTNESDNLTEPVAIGGYTAGLRLMASYVDYASVLTDLTGKITVSHSVSLDDEGKITKWTTLVKSADGLKVLTPAFADIPADISVFIPAKVNGKPVASVVTFHDVDNNIEASKQLSAPTKREVRKGQASRNN